MAALSDWQGYLAANKDLGAAGITDQAGAQAHWDQYGSKEGRSQGTPAAQSTGSSITSIQGTTYSPDQIKQFFAGNPDATAIARQASAFGLNKDQILSAMNTAGYGGPDSASRSAAIDSFVGGSSDGFTFGPHGELQTGDLSGKIWQGTQQVDYGGERKAFSGGLTGQNGQYYSDQQIKDFYKANPNMNPAEEISALEHFGLQGLDLYKARSIATGNAYGGGIYRDMNTDREYEKYVIASRAAGHAPELGYDAWIAAGNAQNIYRTPGSGWLEDFDQNAWDNRFTGQTRSALGDGGGVHGALPWITQNGSGGSQSNASVGTTGQGVNTGGAIYSASGGTPAMNLASLQAGTNMAVDPRTQTVAGQLQSILANDNPLIQQARTRALQTQNANGRLNSSMAQGAADSAMYDAAMQIAVPDANTYNLAAQTNAATANTFSRDANAYTRQQDMANFNVNANNWAAQQEAARQAERDKTLNEQGTTNSATATSNAAKTAAASALNNARAEFASKVSAISMNDTMDAQARTDAIDSLKINYNTIIRASLVTLGWDNPDSWLIV